MYFNYIFENTIYFILNASVFLGANFPGKVVSSSHMFLNFLAWLSTAQKMTIPPVPPLCNEVFILYFTCVTSFNEHNDTFVHWRPVDWFIHECHMFLSCRYIFQSPLLKSTAEQLKAHAKLYLKKWRHTKRGRILMSDRYSVAQVRPERYAAIYFETSLI